MKILITNDDGIESAPLLMLYEALKKDHDVRVMAPHHERSACSQSITTQGALIVRKTGKGLYSCTGTPADCVLVALKGYFDFSFDLVLSGVNRGPNLGSDIIYSGTAAGARQGAMMGVPSVALSQCLDDGFKADYSLAVEWVKKNLEGFKRIWNPSCFLNINFPVNMTCYSETEYCVPGIRIYRDKLEVLRAPNGEDYCFFAFKGWPESRPAPGTDVVASSLDKVTLSAVSILPHGQIVPEDEQILLTPVKERA